MFRKEVDGVTTNAPLAWCRMKMQRIGEGKKKGMEKFRLIWAFDTKMGEDEWSMLRPFVSEEDNGVCNYTILIQDDVIAEIGLTEHNAHVERLVFITDPWG